MGEYSYWSSRFGPAMRFTLGAFVLALVRVPEFVPSYGPRGLWLSCLAVAGVAWATYAARAWGACAVVGDRGVTVHNLGRTIRLSWTVIEGFDVHRNRVGRAGAIVRLRGGGALPLHGIQADLLLHTPLQTHVIETIVGQLNDERSRHR